MASESIEVYFFNFFVSLDTLLNLIDRKTVERTSLETWKLFQTSSNEVEKRRNVQSINFIGQV